MNGGSKFLASAAVLALAGCGGSQAKLQIRATPAPLSAMAKPVPFRIAEANGHLALGNVALALESYRKALREQPDSVEAMAGLAACYDQMARFDLSRRYYESALAVVPADTSVLNAFARSLDLQGLAEEATAVRGEIGVRLASAKLMAKPSPAPALKAAARPVIVVQAAPPVAAPSVTVVLPPPRPVAAAPAKPMAIAARPTPVRQAIVAPVPAHNPVFVAAPAAPVAAKPAPVGQVLAASSPAPLTGPSVTVALPAPKPIATASVVVAVTPRTPAAVTPTGAPVPTATPVAAPIAVPNKSVEPVEAPLPTDPEQVAGSRRQALVPSRVEQADLHRPHLRRAQRHVADGCALNGPADDL